MFKENLPKRGPLFREFWTQNPPIWEAHTCALNMSCYPPPPPGADHLSTEQTASNLANERLLIHPEDFKQTIDGSQLLGNAENVRKMKAKISSFEGK